VRRKVRRRRVEAGRLLPAGLALVLTLAPASGAGRVAGAAAAGAVARQAPAAGELEARRDLPAGAAGNLAAALALEGGLAAAEGKSGAGGAYPEMSRRAEAAEARLAAALDAAPGNAELAEEVYSFYARWGHLLQAVNKAMLAVVGGAPDPALLAFRLGGQPPAGFHRHSVELFAAALAVRPRAAALWVRAAAAAQGPEWRAAFFQEAFARVAPGGGAMTEEAVPAAAAIAESWISQSLAAGLATRALALVRGLPAAVRARLEEGGAGKFETSIGGLPFAGQLVDLRLDLAYAEALAGNAAAARQRLAALPAIAPAAEAASPAGAAELKRRLLERWLAPPHPADDPFGLFADTLANEHFSSDDLAAGWRLLLARDAELEGYPAVAAYVFGDQADRLADGAFRGEPVPTELGVPPSVANAAHDFAAERARLARQLGEDAAAARNRMRAALGPDPAGGAIARRLAAPAGVAFVVRPLAAGGDAASSTAPAAPPGLPGLPAVAGTTDEPPVPADDPWLGWLSTGAAPPTLAVPASGASALPTSGAAGAAGAASAASAAPPGNAPERPIDRRFPAGFKPIRLWQRGKKLAVLGLSEDYDPAMSISAGGYWVLLSDATGKSWMQALYTGLRENLPYTAVRRSKLPLVSGSHLQVEVEIKELDDPLPDDVQYAPADLVPRKAQTGIYLDIPIRALLLDSDGDGLTDLAEERLLTDPRQGDSDGDGTMDGLDATPTIPTTDLPAPEAGVLAEVLAAVIEKSPAAARGAAAPCCPGLGQRGFAEKTVFLIGERPWFAGLAPAYRLIVLTREEEEVLARREPQPVWPSIDLLFLDRARRRALVLWSHGNKGGTLQLEEQSGAWHSAVRSQWDLVTVDTH
jgi:hypothetical protein